MRKRFVARVCPYCGSAKYDPCKPERPVTFFRDRQCRRCGVRYIPPTPAWAVLLLLLIGTPVLLSGGVGALLLMANGEPHIVGLVLTLFFAAIGGACIVEGFRGLLVTVEPDAPDDPERARQRRQRRRDEERDERDDDRPGRRSRDDAEDADDRPRRRRPRDEADAD